MSWKIKKIVIENFKYFHEKFLLDVNSRNLLIYGENGSGKSSIYWALYTLFQSRLKLTDADVEKYFDATNDLGDPIRLTLAVEIMGKICEYVESTIDYSKHVSYKGTIGISDTIAKLVTEAAEYTDIKVIVTTTMTGFTARKISNLRPNATILACCPSKHIAEKVVLNFGVKPVITDIYKATDKMVENAREMAKKEFNLKKGDLIIITGGFPIGESRKTNYLRIMEI